MRPAGTLPSIPPPSPPPSRPPPVPSARIIFARADQLASFGLSCYFCGLYFGVVNGNTPLPFRFWGCLKVPEL
jgi:hypothetical protein